MLSGVGVDELYSLIVSPKERREIMKHTEGTYTLNNLNEVLGMASDLLSGKLAATLPDTTSILLDPPIKATLIRETLSDKSEVFNLAINPVGDVGENPEDVTDWKQAIRLLDLVWAGGWRPGIEIPQENWDMAIVMLDLEDNLPNAVTRDLVIKLGGERMSTEAVMQTGSFPRKAQG
jgi:hypothetical protein